MMPIINDSTPVERVLANLDARRTGRGRWMARCPAHLDRTPSLSVREGDDGRVLLFCFAGCETADVLEALDLDWRDLFTAPLTTGREGAACSVRRRRRNSVPPISASDALALLDRESLVVQLVARQISQGEDAETFHHVLTDAASRIAAVRWSFLGAT